MLLKQIHSIENFHANYINELQIACLENTGFGIFFNYKSSTVHGMSTGNSLPEFFWSEQETNYSK